MKLLILLFLFPLASFGANNPVILTYQLKSPRAKVKKLYFNEIKWIYTLTRQQTPYYPPSPQQFFQDYLRFQLGVEVALNEKKLVTSPNIEKYIVSPYLKTSFQQELYKAFAELKLQKQIRNIGKQASQLSDGQLRAMYRKDPQYNFFYISVNHPLNPSKAQVAEARSRAKQIYGQVKSSKKPFVELVGLYSDDKLGGQVNWNQTRGSILPPIYKAIQKMRIGAVSQPVKIPTGYVIIKLNRKVPFSKEIHAKPLKENYFAEKRTQVFNSYMDRLKTKFKIKFVNRKLINKLK